MATAGESLLSSLFRKYANAFLPSPQRREDRRGRAIFYLAVRDRQIKSTSVLSEHEFFAV